MRVVIADDQRLFRDMLKEILELDKDFEVVAVCCDGKEAIDACAVNTPQIALLDIGMPGVSGTEALVEIKRRFPEIKVCLLTTFESEEKIRLAIHAGADGYIIKDIKPHALRLALKAIDEGMVVFQKGVYDQMLTRGLMQPRHMEKKFEVDGIIFDAVDMTLLKHIASGCSNKDIAQLMNYSEGTIKNRVSKLLAMTGLSDRTEISVFAVKNQLV